MISFRMHLIIINLDCQRISWAGYYSNWIKWLLSAVWYVDSTAYLITILQRGCKYSACIKNTVLIWRWKIHVRHCWLTGMITFSYLCTFFQFLYAIILVAFLNEFFFNFFSLEVPDDVFAPDFVWKGSYDYKGQKQPMTLTVTSFNATAGKVNVTLTDSSMEFLLSGESSINHVSSSSSPPPPLSSSRYLCMSLPFILRVPHVNQSITKWSHAWEWKLTIGSKDGCISLRWLTNCPLKSHSSPPLLLQPFSHLFWSFLTASHLSCFSLFLPLLCTAFFYSFIIPLHSFCLVSLFI